ncbi:transglycosylase SLT domain-containing protein [Kutzneria buriramensis]|uniref:WXG100 family type VII secretion target n=1 Tax=Kutzneria buriramensis TaxID=1045776 RepID=A0A3E0I8M5_9PSEU|nr:transglycosylase SLT domain-containing protein [Kutzneria buriramensis]REH55072.1 WXG100 family type VII secretion target [Kutzneria buriramensis]
MSAADDVAGLPGGGEVADIARKMENAQPQAVRDIATHWRDSASKCDDQGKAVTSAVNALDGAWAGGSADSFTAYMANFTKAGTSMSEALNNGAAALEAAAGALEQAKSAVDGRCENLLGEARKWDAAHPNPQPGERDAAIKPMCDAAKGDVQKSVDAANNELNNALNQLKGATTIASKFSALPAPGDQSFTPAPGRSIDWQAKPDPGQTGTTPQGANPPASSGGDSHSGGSSNSGGGGGYGGGGGGGGDDGGGGGGLGPSGGPPAGGGGPAPQGQVKEWIDEAMKILQENGVDTSKMSENDIWAIIQHESGGNPHAINLWDSNAKAGHPSKGLMQCIDSTFQSNKLPGHDDIYNPVDNIIAGVRYSIARYGSVSNVPGIRSMAHGGAYQGY